MTTAWPVPRRLRRPQVITFGLYPGLSGSAKQRRKARRAITRAAAEIARAQAEGVR